MRIPLQKFTDFTRTLLPSETAFLLSAQKFRDAARLKILERVHYNAVHIDQFTPYDTKIDKRKYNHLQNWIQTRLDAVDVDVQLQYFLHLEEKIATDSIQPDDEQYLLSMIKKYQHPTFFFSKFYELIENYYHFLLIRLRYADHAFVANFLQKYRADYLYARHTRAQLLQATTDIVGQYAGTSDDSNQWEHQMSAIFYDETIEGHLRYLALVRLVFISHNYQKYTLLREKFLYLEEKFSQGIYYSKRLLLNYYNNRLMLHAHFGEYDKAVYYGKLSVRAKTHDYLLYVNNFCAVLLRLQQKEEALQLMQDAAAAAKITKNYYNRVGYVAFYMEALNKNGRCQHAENYGDTFLKAYRKEILQYRWHLFFSVYLEAMAWQQHFDKMIQTIHRYGLIDRDASYRQRANYLPAIPFFEALAHYQEGAMSAKVFTDVIDRLLQNGTTEQSRKIQKWVYPFKQICPILKKYKPLV